MNLRYIAELTIVRISQRKRNFLLVILVLFFSGFLVLMTLSMLFTPGYRVFKIKRLLCDDDLLRIRAIPTVWIEGYQDRVEAFDVKAAEIFGQDYVKYMVKPISVDADDPESGRIDVLMIDKSMIELCRLGNKLNLLKEGSVNNENIRAYVGYELVNQYPVGSIVEDVFTGSRMDIVGVLPKGAEWLPENIFYGKDYSLELDKLIICNFDKRLMGDDNYSYMNIINNMFVKYHSDEDRERKETIIRKLEEEYPIACYADTVENEIKSEKVSRLELIKSTYILVLFCLAVGFGAYLSASLADAYFERKDNAIRLIYGTSHADLFMSVLSTNLIRMLIASGISVFVFSRIQYTGGMDLYCLLIMPAFFLVSVISAVFVTIITWLVCYKSHPMNVLREFNL